MVVLDKGRRAGGRLATKELGGGALADHGAQFFTARTPELQAEVDRWLADGVVHEWCRGFGSADGHPRYAVRGGMAALGVAMGAGLDVRQSVHVDAIEPAGVDRWQVRWAERRGRPAGAVEADAIVVTAPPAQAAALLAPHLDVPSVAYEPMLSLVVALDGPASVPPPGGVQLADDPTWSWVGDNVAKGTSPDPAVTLHTRSDLALARFDDDLPALTAELLVAARPWLGEANVIEAALHRWRYATSGEAHPDRCVALADARVVLAGDGYGGPRVEGAFSSGRAAAAVVLRRLDGA